MTDQETLTFIRNHRHDDPRQLALSIASQSALDRPFVLSQIQGWQTACKKLPTWAATDGIIYPPHLNMEQCSSEQTARYKAQVICRLMSSILPNATFIDLTGGFGVDFSFISTPFSSSVYVERNESLCAVVSENLAVLGLSSAQVVCGDGVDYLRHLPVGSVRTSPCVIYLDPARRDTHGRKVFDISDCEPDLLTLREELMDRADVVMVKLSPMYDWHAAIAALTHDGRGAEVHIVSVANECKELVLVLTHEETPLRVYCVNDDSCYAYLPSQMPVHLQEAGLCRMDESQAKYLLVPHSSVMKAGCFEQLSMDFGVCQLAPNSHLFVSDRLVPDFPGRTFVIQSIFTLNKKELRTGLQDLTHANIAVRNFPISVAELRKRLKLKDGGSTYIFATTWGERHVLIRCEKEE